MDFSKLSSEAYTGSMLDLLSDIKTTVELCESYANTAENFKNMSSDNVEYTYMYDAYSAAFRTSYVLVCRLFQTMLCLIVSYHGKQDKRENGDIRFTLDKDNLNFAKDKIYLSKTDELHSIEYDSYGMRIYKVKGDDREEAVGVISPSLTLDVLYNFDICLWKAILDVSDNLICALNNQEI